MIELLSLLLKLQAIGDMPVEFSMSQYGQLHYQILDNYGYLSDVLIEGQVSNEKEAMLALSEIIELLTKNYNYGNEIIKS
jgi:hypothetical protein